MDQIHIRQLKLSVVIGVYPCERKAPQAVIVDLALHTDLQVAGRSDRLTDTIDYAELVARIRKAAAKSRCQLLEALAEHIAGVCLREPRIAAVDVTVAKPGALSGVDVAVTLHRSRSSL
ncbi:MAG: dihydroneopterin aldolase [Kiritimatiellaeota bacterium]|nr:dihydroneopterin aldolase [Kiritimatiellota bacterium]